jgi:hypothetical protein
MKACVLLFSAGGLLVVGPQLAYGQRSAPVGAMVVATPVPAVPPAAEPAPAPPGTPAPAAPPAVVVAPQPPPPPAVEGAPQAPPPVVVTTAPPAGAPASAVQTAPSGATQQVQIFTAPPPPPPAVMMPPPPPPPVVMMPAPPPPPCPVCPPAPVVYAAPAQPSGSHAHDGFFLRMSVGGGYLGTRDDRSAGNPTFHGGAGAFALALGGAVGDNVIIYGEAIGQQVDNGELKLSYSRDQHREDGHDVIGSMGLYGGGPGLAYYFMPYNTYISGTLLFTRLVWSEDDLGEEDSTEDNVYSEPGVGFSVSVGKEWWVSRNWGLGVAARLNYSANEQASDQSLARFGDTTRSLRDRRFDTWGISVALSATFN